MFVRGHLSPRFLWPQTILKPAPCATVYLLLQPPNPFRLEILLLSYNFLFHKGTLAETRADISLLALDYAIPAYAALAASAQTLWRQNWGRAGAYHENGLCFTSHHNGGGGEGYVRSSLESVRALNRASGDEEHSIEFLKDAAEIKRVMKGAGGGSGDWGYVNWKSGWVDAEAAVEEARRKICALTQMHAAGVEWIRGSASRLLYSSSSDPSQPTQKTITGVLLTPFPSPSSSTSPSPSASTSTSRPLLASLTILATGAYTPALLPLSLSPRLTATGQVIGYMQLSAAECARLGDIPVLLNESTGMFIIPPTREGILKVARHGFGYRNAVRVRVEGCERNGKRGGEEEEEGRGGGEGEGETKEIEIEKGEVEISIPADDYTTLPTEATHALHAAIQEMIPWLPPRLFAATRVCWYADTPTGDFLIDYHPAFGKTLLVATGGSGHAFKFLPVLGRKIVERLEGQLGGRDEQKGDMGRLWAWGEGREGEWWCEDGSRGGGRGMRYVEEMAKPRHGNGGEEKGSGSRL